MTEINKGNIGEFVITGTFDISGKVSLDEEMKAKGEGKDFTFRFQLNRVPARDVLIASLTPKKINKASAIRKNWEMFKDGQILEFDWTGGRTPVDVEAAYHAKFNAMSRDEQLAEIARLKAEIESRKNK